jgi:hypothetical protein
MMLQKYQFQLRDCSHIFHVTLVTSVATESS